MYYDCENRTTAQWRIASGDANSRDSRGKRGRIDINVIHRYTIESSSVDSCGQWTWKLLVDVYRGDKHVQELFK